MLNYAEKTYGRNEEVEKLYRLFEAGRNVSMHGPRRLGKTFVLDRIVDSAAKKKWTAVKVELAGCADSRSVFRELCSRIGKSRSGGTRAISWILQRLGQFIDPRTENGGAWYQPFITLDHEAYFERLIHAMHDDKATRWVLLIDELPIFLKTLHEKGPSGISAARDFMNMLIRLQQRYSNVRWMITGSIGIEPLAQEGKYMGVLAKFINFELGQLTLAQAKDYVQDLAKNGQLMNRDEITDLEAEEIVKAVGWLAAFYLEALSQKIQGDPQLDIEGAKRTVTSALSELIDLKEATLFGVWEEHIRKHYDPLSQKFAFDALGQLCQGQNGLSFSTIIQHMVQQPAEVEKMRGVLMRLTTDGFLAVSGWDIPSPNISFTNPLLRRWWIIARPHVN